MKSILSGDKLFIDVRACDRPEALSYDLSRHLPRRMIVGPAVVVASNPSVFLSVVRKRLAKLLYEIECQRARTLDRKKRDGLAYEARLFKTYRFTTKPITSASPDALFVAGARFGEDIPACATIYITVEVSALQLQHALKRLRTGGLLVVYGQWPPAYEQAVADHLAMV